MNKGIIFDIKRFALHDGPGIRTTVFLKGCPLRCSWCHNPESQAFGLTHHSGTKGTLLVGREVTVDEIVAQVEKDTTFFDESGGGVTFSGGEPLGQAVFLHDMLIRCGELAIHRAVDTSGYASESDLLTVAGETDLFLYDIKLLDEKQHRTYTGVELSIVLENLIALCETDVPIRLRFPIIPGITDTEKNLISLIELINALPRQLPVDCLPYHAAAMDKYPRFGMPVPLPDVPEPTADDMARVHRFINER